MSTTHSISGSNHEHPLSPLLFYTRGNPCSSVSRTLMEAEEARRLILEERLSETKRSGETVIGLERARRQSTERRLGLAEQTRDELASAAAEAASSAAKAAVEREKQCRMSVERRLDVAEKANAELSTSAASAATAAATAAKAASAAAADAVARMGKDTANNPVVSDKDQAPRSKASTASKKGGKTIRPTKVTGSEVAHGSMADNARASSPVEDRASRGEGVAAINMSGAQRSGRGGKSGSDDDEDTVAAKKGLSVDEIAISAPAAEGKAQKKRKTIEEKTAAKDIGRDSRGEVSSEATAAIPSGAARNDASISEASSVPARGRRLRTQRKAINYADSYEEENESDNSDASEGATPIQSREPVLQVSASAVTSTDNASEKQQRNTNKRESAQETTDDGESATKTTVAPEGALTAVEEDIPATSTASPAVAVSGAKPSGKGRRPRARVNYAESTSDIESVLEGGDGVVVGSTANAPGHRRSSGNGKVNRRSRRPVVADSPFAVSDGGLGACSEGEGDCEPIRSADSNKSSGNLQGQRERARRVVDDDDDDDDVLENDNLNEDMMKAGQNKPHVSTATTSVGKRKGRREKRTTLRKGAGSDVDGDDFATITETPEAGAKTKSSSGKRRISNEAPRAKKRGSEVAAKAKAGSPETRVKEAQEVPSPLPVPKRRRKADSSTRDSGDEVDSQAKGKKKKLSKGTEKGLDAVAREQKVGEVCPRLGRRWTICSHNGSFWI